jgi:hypothetical protein
VGAWDSFVLMRAAHLVGPLAEWDDAGEAVGEFDGDWTLWRFPDSDVAEDAVELVEGLVTATRHPVLTAYLIDGDQLDLTGFSWTHGLWQAMAPPTPADRSKVARQLCR